MVRYRRGGEKKDFFLGGGFVIEKDHHYELKHENMSL